MEDKLETFVTEARARIIWGNCVDEVREWLRAEGLDESDVELIVSKCTRERSTEVRKIGFRDMLIGLSLFLVGAGILLAQYFVGIISRNLFIISGLLGLFGLWRIIGGVEKLLNGSKMKGSLIEM